MGRARRAERNSFGNVPPEDREALKTWKLEGGGNAVFVKLYQARRVLTGDGKVRLPVQELMTKAWSKHCILGKRSS
eukprot:SAG22_NODE_314_length_12607_cov_177.638311_2_plen_76_part_00